MSTTYAVRPTSQIEQIEQTEPRHGVPNEERPALRAVPADPERSPVGQVRLTRRGRTVVFALALLAVLAAFWLLPSGSSASGEGEGTEVLVVGTGQTLWQIASVRADEGDTLAMVEHIKDLNRLDTGVLLAGQELRVPALEQ